MSGDDRVWLARFCGGDEWWWWRRIWRGEEEESERKRVKQEVDRSVGWILVWYSGLFVGTCVYGGGGEWIK